MSELFEKGPALRRLDEVSHFEGMEVGLASVNERLTASRVL